METTL